MNPQRPGPGPGDRTEPRTETTSAAALRRLGRLWPGRALAEMHYRLRSQDGSPMAKALSVAVGTLIGCMPLYGLHLPLCLIAARLLRVSSVRAYLAANLNNPFTAPLLLYVELGLGRWLTTGSWPALDRDELAAGAQGVRLVALLGRDLLLGGALLGVALGALFGLIAWWIARRWRRPSFDLALVDIASRPYVEAGVIHWEFVRGKLRHDPVYLSLLREPVLPESGRVLDLGCGRGGALALLAAAQKGVPGAEDGSGDSHWAVDWGVSWPGEWARQPHRLELTGIEHSPRLARAARLALDGVAEVRTGDLGDPGPLPDCDVVLLIDVLHYLDPDAQERLLAAVGEALSPGGVVLIREADADRGWRFTLTRIQERFSALCRGHLRQRFHYRSAAGWRRLLARHGLPAAARPMWRGTPFGNVLVEAQKRAGTG